MERVRARELSNGYAMEFTQPTKRSRFDEGGQYRIKRESLGDFPQDNDQNHDDPWKSSRLDQLMSLSSSEANPYYSWRLPSSHSLEMNENYLNEQMEHVVASSTNSTNSTRKFLSGPQTMTAEEEAQLCRLDLHQLWQLLLEKSDETDKKLRDTVESNIRATMDLVSYLLFVRTQEIARQDTLNETIHRMEKELQRNKHTIQQLSTDLEAHKQNMAQQENYFKAKEKAYVAERKTLQTEKKSLEVICARLQGVETAYKAQLRKKDAEYERLRKNIQESVTRSSAKGQRGITVDKPLNGVKERQQVSTNVQSVEIKMTNKILENLERKKAELLFENDDLAKSYDTLQHQLESLTSQYKKAVHLFVAQKNAQGNVSAELEELARAPIDDFTPTAFNIATKQNLPQYIAESMQHLHSILSKFEDVMRSEVSSEVNNNSEEVIAILRRKLDDAHAIIVEQDQLLQASLLTSSRKPSNLGSAAHQSNDPLSSCTKKSREKSDTNGVRHRRGFVGSRSMVDVSELENLAEDIEYEKQELIRQRANLDQERQLLRDQASKLDKDRLAFEVAKHEIMFDSCNRQHPNNPTESDDNTDKCTTPRKQVKPDVTVDTTIDPESPFALPVPATPDTAALLKKMGITTYDGLSDM